jgi:hypothetical protein
MKDNDQKLLWEAYQVINESLTPAEALERIRGAVANGFPQIIPDILDAVDNKDKQAVAEKAIELGIEHEALTALARRGTTPTAAGGSVSTAQPGIGEHEENPNAAMDHMVASAILKDGVIPFFEGATYGTGAHRSPRSFPSGLVGQPDWMDYLRFELDEQGGIEIFYADFDPDSRLSGELVAKIEARTDTNTANPIRINWKSSRPREEGGTGMTIIMMHSGLPGLKEGQPTVENINEQLRTLKEESWIGKMMFDIENGLNADFDKEFSEGSDDGSAYA